MQDIDLLIRRLRERVADPDRRVDRSPDPSADGEELDTASLLVPLGRRQPDLSGFVDLRSLETAAPGLRLCASAGEIESIGTVLGVAVPAVLARALRDVADGGFGPGCGLFGTAELVRMTGRCRREAEAAADPWPAGRLPVADLGDGVLACVATDQPDAPVLRFDPARVGEVRLADAFVPESPSLAAWLASWATAPADA